MAAPTPISSLVHSSTLVTSGVYLFIRYYIFFDYYLSYFLILVRVITSFMSGLMALVGVDLKKIVAISTLSQLGLIIFSISVGEFEVGFFHIISHALFKSLLFLGRGIVILRVLGNQDIRFIGSSFFTSRFIFLLIVFCSLSLVGIPFISGFYSRDLIIESSITIGLGLFVFLILFFSCVFSVMYSFKLVDIVFIYRKSGVFLNYFNSLNLLRGGLFVLFF